MKTILIFIALAFTMGTPLTAQQVDPATAADQLAAKAIQDGKVNDAMKWSQVALQVRANRYIGPISELMDTFAGTVPNIPAFIDANAAVEEVTPVTSWHHSKFASQAAKAVFRDNSPEAMKVALVKGAIWDLVRESTPDDMRYGSKAPKVDQYQELFLWVNGGCQGDRTEFVTQVTSNPVVERKLPALVALLAPKKETAAK